MPASQLLRYSELETWDCQSLGASINNKVQKILARVYFILANPFFSAECWRLVEINNIVVYHIMPSHFDE
jgi:hypothetical protein